MTRLAHENFENGIMTLPADRSYRWLFWLLAIVGLAADQSSKYLIFGHLYNEGRGGQLQIIPDAFQLTAQFEPHPDEHGIHQPLVNKGALFGMGQGQNLAFGIVSVIAAVVIIGWSVRPHAGRDAFLCVSLGLILGGTFGNLYDRVVFDGVRDFLRWYKWFDWYVFNVADVCLVIGAGMLVLEAFLRQPTEEPAAEPALTVGERE